MSFAKGRSSLPTCLFWAGRWYKPKLLFTQDVDEIPTPDPDEVYIVYCDMCEDFLDRQVATKVCTRQGRGWWDARSTANGCVCWLVQFCESCQTALCDEHDHNVHSRGRRSKHSRIPLNVRAGASVLFQIVAQFMSFTHSPPLVVSAQSCEHCEYQNITRRCKHCKKNYCDTVSAELAVRSALLDLPR